MKKQHRFIQVSAGGTFPNSWSFKKCRYCGVTLTHYYQRESFEEALKRAGISKFCKGRLDDKEERERR